MNLYRTLSSAGTNPRYMIFYKTGPSPAGVAEIARFNINNTDNGLTLFNCTAVPPSDKRLKSVVDSSLNFLNVIKQINPVKFTWKNTENKTEYVGFLAQDLFNVVPEAVYPGDVNEPTVDQNNIKVENQWGVDYSYLVSYAIGAIKELSAKVDELESRLI